MVGQNIKKFREEKGLRQEDLAEVHGVSRQTIGYLENGRYNPSILLAYKISRYFKCTIEDIFIYEEEGTLTGRHCAGFCW